MCVYLIIYNIDALSKCFIILVKCYTFIEFQCKCFLLCAVNCMTFHSSSAHKHRYAMNSHALITSFFTKIIIVAFVGFKMIHSNI